MVDPVISAARAREETYTATAGQTDFAIPFAYFAASDVRAEVRRLNDDDELELVASYRGWDGLSIDGPFDEETQGECSPISDASLSGEVAGTLTILACEEGDEVTLYGETSPERDASYTGQGEFAAARINREFNRRVAVEVEIRESIARILSQIGGLGANTIAAFWRDILVTSSSHAALQAAGLGNSFVFATRWLNTEGEDNSAAAVEMMDWLGDLDPLQRPSVLWPAGDFAAEEWPNLALENIRHIPIGKALLRSTGAASLGIPLDGATGMQGVTFGLEGLPFHVAAPNDATRTLYASFLNKSYVNAVCIGGGAAAPAILINGSVLSKFAVLTSHHANGGAWLDGARPHTGIKVEGSFAASQLLNPQGEDLEVGIDIGSSGDGIIEGGSSELCVLGLKMRTGSFGWDIRKHDLEVNTKDALIEGQGHTLGKVSSETLIEVGGERIQFDSGEHKSILLNASSVGCYIPPSLTYNRNGGGGTITNLGRMNVIDRPRNGVSNRHDPDSLRYHRWRDDFDGKALDTRHWKDRAGSAGGAVSIAGFQNGFCSLISGNDALATIAANGVQIDAECLQLRPDKGEIILSFGGFLDALSTQAWAMGATDQVGSLKIPITISGTTPTANVTDGAVILLDTDATIDNWYGVAVKNGVVTALVDLGAPSAAGQMEHFQLGLDTAGKAWFYRDGELKGSVANAVTPSVLLSRYAGGFSRAAVARALRLDYVEQTVFRGSAP